MPGCLLGDPFHKYVGFLFYQFRNALAEFTADVVERDIGIFDRIVQCGCRQEFLVAGHGGGNRDGLHRVDNVREVYVYLTNDYRRQYSFAGAIFMDVACSSDFSDQETMIYGHNMHNGDMFGRLKKFEDDAYREAHSEIYILLPSGDIMKYSARIGEYISVKDDVYSLPKKGDGPETLVLSTCTDDSSDTTRFVLIGDYEDTIKG